MISAGEDAFGETQLAKLIKARELACVAGHLAEGVEPGGGE